MDGIEGIEEVVAPACAGLQDEESRLIKDLIVGGSVERSHAASWQGSGDVLADLLGNVSATLKVVEVATARVRSVFATSA